MHVHTMSLTINSSNCTLQCVLTDLTQGLFVAVSNRGPETATIHVLPTLWFRNTWIWGCKHEGCTLKPWIIKTQENQVTTRHDTLGGKMIIHV